MNEIQVGKLKLIPPTSHKIKNIWPLSRQSVFKKQLSPFIT